MEVKCPWSARNGIPFETLADKDNFCLQRLKNGMKFNINHLYYLHCQLQMHVTNRAYCDFVVWSPTELHSECIKVDDRVLQQAIMKAEHFFRLCVLPEILGRGSGSLVGSTER